MSHSEQPDRARVAWWNRVSVKLIAVVTVVSLVSIAAFAWIALRVQERYLTDEVVRGAARVSDAIKASTYHNMLDDRREAAYRSMKTVSGLEGIEKVRVINKEGRVTFSTDEGEIGRLVDRKAEACYACHAAGQPLVRLNLPSRSRIFRTGDRRVLGIVTPIYNETACSTSGCHAHPPGQQVLGVVDVSLSLADIDAEIAALRRRTFFVAVLAIPIVGVSGALFGRRVIVRPVSELVAATERIAHLELDQRIPVRRTDEIGQLGASFNRMIDSLRVARQDLRELNQSLERQVEERTLALQEAQARLVQSEKLSSLGRLAASIAHEINNPLAGILTCSKLLLRMHDEGDDCEAGRDACQRYLKLIQRETERCSAIVRNLLDFARQRPLALVEVDVNHAIDEAVTLLSNQIAIRGLGLERRSPAVPRVVADPGQLRQAVLNVALNACEAMALGGMLTIETRHVQAQGAVEMSVADTGPGIPPEILSKIFDPFFTTKENGTGLGLSVVYGIVERHGGRLEVESQVGRGTKVTIRLPVSAAAGPGPARSQAGAAT